MCVLLVPDELWVYACPPALLFGDAEQGIQGIEPGYLSPITKTGPGGGSVEVEGIARDAFSVVLRCVVGGEINVSEQANPGPLPVFEVSRNNGANFGRRRRVTDNRDEAYIDDANTGLRFLFKNGTAPSFVAGTTYAFTTQPSPDIVAMIPAVEAEIFEAAAGSYDPPISGAPPHWKKHAARLLRWELLTKIGVSKRRDVLIYYPKDTYAWMEMLGDGRRAVKGAAQGVGESPPGTSFPMLVPPLPDPLVPKI